MPKQNVDDAIDLVISRRGRPKEDDWDLLEAAETLATEVVQLRRLLAMKTKKPTTKK